MTQLWLKIGSIASVFMGIYATAHFLVKEPLIGIRQNVSDSLPYSFFLSTRIGIIKSQMFVSFEHPKSAIPLAKQIIGLPGDFVTIKNKTLYINERCYGLIQERTSAGDPIHPIPEGKIPEGYLFVYASHPKSFDSRYEEFGLVAISALMEALWPLF